MILKKNNTDRSVLFVDASREFRKEGPRNYLDPEHIEKIVKAVSERKDIEKFAHLAFFEEINSKDFSLSIPQYVDTSEEEDQIDIPATLASLSRLDAKEAEINKKLAATLKELGIDFIVEGQA